MLDHAPSVTVPLLAEVKAGLYAIYGDRLRGMYLYGSYARGEQDAESDVDILVVLNEVPDYWAEINRTSELISRLSLDYGVSVSRVFIPESQWNESASPFLRNVRHDAIAA